MPLGPGTLMEASYLAGLLDADGNVGFLKAKKGGGYAYLNIANTNYGLIKAVEEIVGKDYTTIVDDKRTVKQPHKNWRPCYQIRLRGGRATFRYVLDCVYPFMRESHKKQVVGKMLDFYDIRNDERAASKCKLSDEERELYQEVLNLRPRVGSNGVYA